MTREHLFNLLGGGQVARNLMTAASVMLGRGQSNIANDILHCGLLVAGMSPMQHYEPKELFEALREN